jgi:hypothetical protein
MLEKTNQIRGSGRLFELESIPRAARRARLRGLAAGLLLAALAAGGSEASAATFTSLSLQPGWTNAPFSTRNASVSVVAGIVHFAGAIATTQSDPLAFVLPIGFRPATNVYVPVDLCGATSGRLFIQPNGETRIEAEGGNWFNAQCFTSLEGASFAPSANGFTAVALQPGWTNAPFGTSSAAVMVETTFGLVGDIVHFKGAIASGGGPGLFTLPAPFRPAATVYVPVDLCGATNGRLVIQPSGAVSVDAENGNFANAQCFTSLDGAWFARNAGSLPPLNGWAGAPFGTGAPSIEDIRGIVYFKGAVATGSDPPPPPFVLPASFRPATDVYVPVDLCNATKGRLYIHNGTVTVQAEGGANGNAECFTSLDGASFANSTAATTDIFNSHFPIDEIHSVHGASTAGSLAASAMMGAHGFSSITIPGSWDSMITGSCVGGTSAPFADWPGGCGPGGMASAVHAFTGNDWTVVFWTPANQTAALNTLVTSLQSLQSPALVPIFGQSDHWVTVTQITGTLSNNTWSVGQVKVLDGGPPGSSDSGTNSYVSGLQAWSGSVWKNVFWIPVQTLSPQDPYFGDYVMIYEPPRGQPHALVSAVFPRAPGVVAVGDHAMTEPLARLHVWRSLAAAGVQADPEIWNAIRDGAPGDAFEVNAAWPSGDAWDYYLVPIVSKANLVIAFVQLAADDGSFESIHVLGHPTRFAPVTRAHAAHLAQGALARGESLTDGILTWDPRSNAQLTRSPTRPYYEFGILGATGGVSGAVRVALDDGTVVRGR